MSESQTNNPKNNLKKLDNFIQESLYKYIQVKAWDELYKNTGKDHKEIISNKSTIPDLVIYNKGFNKLDCFYYPNKKRENIKFPRILFLLRPKKVKEYNPSSSNIVFNEQKKNEEKFEFKSIPKEIEDKYIGNNKEEEKNVINELNDFMKINNDKQPKINIIKGNIGNKKENDKKIDKNNAEKSQKNKFNIPNMNNSNDYYRKCMEYQNYIFQKMRYNAINNNQYLATNITNKMMEINPMSENNNIINDNLKENKPSNNFEQKGNAPDYLNFEEIMKNNMTERIWIVHNENNEELYYLLNIILKNGEFKKYSIISNKFPDIFISPEELLDILKKILQKK